MSDNYDPNCHHNVYVVLLDRSVLNEAKFKVANPNYAEDKRLLPVCLATKEAYFDSPFRTQDEH